MFSHQAILFTLLLILTALHSHCQTLNAFTSTEKSNIILLHTNSRASVSPAATDMKPITWDDALAQTAANYVDSCVFEHNANRGSNVGENIYMGYDAAIGNRSVASWVSEQANWSYQNGCTSGKVCGHYTQVIWASTTKVGCARKTCATVANQPNFNGATIVVCDYSPAGNVANQKPYTAAATGTSTQRNNGAATAAYGMVWSGVGLCLLGVLLML